MKIKSYAARLNKEALKNLPSAQLQQKRKQYFIVEYFMVFAVHRHRIDHWRLTEAEKVAILSLSPKNQAISAYEYLDNAHRLVVSSYRKKPKRN